MNLITLKRNKIKTESDFQINGKIIVNNRGQFKIKSKCLINSGSDYNPISPNSRFTRIIVRENAILEIGNNVGISNTSIYSANKIIIGDNVLIGDGTRKWDTDFHSLNPEIRNFEGDYQISTKPIKIKNGAFIGGDSIVLKGVTIGENSIIGAGSVVSKNIPPNEIWAGNPAKFIKSI